RSRSPYPPPRSRWRSRATRSDASSRSSRVEPDLPLELPHLAQQLTHPCLDRELDLLRVTTLASAREHRALDVESRLRGIEPLVELLPCLPSEVSMASLDGRCWFELAGGRGNQLRLLLELRLRIDGAWVLPHEVVAEGVRPWIVPKAFSAGSVEPAH